MLRCDVGTGVVQKFVALLRGVRVPYVTPKRPYVSLQEPCATCPHPECCWNYAKEPDPDNPAGPWRIVSWFDCDRAPDTEGVKP